MTEPKAGTGIDKDKEQAERAKETAGKTTPEPKAAETPDEIVTRIEGNVARMHAASPSGTESIQAEITKDLESLRATAPPPVRAASKSGYHPVDEDEDDEKAKGKKGKG